MPSTCRDCGVDILWLRLADSGKAIAVNYSRVPGGVLDNTPTGAVWKRPNMMEAGFVPHRRTCVEEKKAQAEARAEKQAAREKKRGRQLKLF